MNFLWRTLLKGLSAILPVGLTIYLLYWLAISTESILRPIITLIVPPEHYWPGMGLAAGLGLLFAIGLAVNAWLVRQLFRLGETLLETIPLVKSIYSTLRDFMQFFSKSKQKEDLKQVVLVKQGNGHVIGFLTEEIVDDIPGLPESNDYSAVYIPMSYQIGGFTVYLSKDEFTHIDMKVEDAMRRVLTAGLSKSKPKIEK